MFVFSVSEISQARPKRVNQVPNGSKFSCMTCHTGSGGPRNLFGQAIEGGFLDGNGDVTWNATLAGLDSDGDGVSNGAELQDSNGTWSIGQPQPGDINLVTNPGDATSTDVISGIIETPYVHEVIGVDANGSVEPDTVIYKITKVTDTYGNIVNIASPADSAMVLAYEIPVVDITSPPGNKTYNINADADTLVGNPVGGVFSGNGIIPSNNTFLASSAGVGTHEIVYKYTVPYSGCFDLIR